MKGGENTNFDKKFVMIALIVILSLTTTVFAVLWVQKQVDITGGITAMGNIEVYDSDGVTVLTSYTFSNFTPGDSEIQYKYFFINNTGNSPVYVTWNISDSTLSWIYDSMGYLYPGVLSFDIYEVLSNTWTPHITGVQSESILIDVDEGVEFYIRHAFDGSGTAMSYSLKMNFYAEDA